jgi:glyceraldehyde 3-phosphate dehydrogenase
MLTKIGIDGFDRMGRLAMRTGWLQETQRQLVSIDHGNKPRSSIVDAISTLVIIATQVKFYVWCDNAWGYVSRLIHLARKVAAMLPE